MMKRVFLLNLILIYSLVGATTARAQEQEVSDVYDTPAAKSQDDETQIAVSDREAIESILGELKRIKFHPKKPKAALKGTFQFRKIANIKKMPLNARLTQAKELMGKEYRSYFKFAKLIKAPDHHIHEYVKLAFSDFDKKARVRAHDTSRAILSESKKYGFDPFFLLAVIENESRFDLKARGDAGEIGLMQILPETGKWISEKYGWKWRGERTLLDPVQNVKIGAAYLNLLREKFESESQLYISAYNMGPANVYKALSHQVTPKDYHSKVLEYYISYYRQIKKQFEDQSSNS